MVEGVGGGQLGEKKIEMSTEELARANF